ncbi:hypothetical protein IFO69_03410 [Echinicola sp. CAU 1574]|uniref:Adenylosuccinate synthetase n=1 Tax=Echinicola arenosa TaxID=2774144 RepID=A0ABR9AIM7_9BACT|nr:hypothetical protein [Echinicola arenosa]MBD8487790.1 hypothetical protein [Echinicola arenosa]
MKYTDKTAITFSTLIGLILILSQPLFAQIPTGTPRSDEPINLNSTADIIIYVVLPLVIIVLGIFWWFFYKKPKNQKDKNKGMD